MVLPKKCLIRISTYNSGKYFLLGSDNYLIESVKFAPVKSDICCMCKHIMDWLLTPLLKSYAEANNLHHNSNLCYDTTLIQFIWDTPKESAYALHNDINVLLCSAGLDDNNYPAEQVVVATMLITYLSLPQSHS